MELGRDSCAHGFIRRAWVDQKMPSQPTSSPHTLSSRSRSLQTRGGMWTQNVNEGKTDRVHPHGPLWPHQLVSHSPTHWITQDALLDTIDAIDEGVSQHHARHPATHQTVLRAAELHEVHTAAGPSVRASLQELDPQRGGQHFAEFFMEVESNFEHVNLDSSTSVLRQLLFSFVHTAAQNADSPQRRIAGWRFIDWNEVEQRELLAEAKTPSGDGRTVSTRHS